MRSYKNNEFPLMWLVCTRTHGPSYDTQHYGIPRNFFRVIMIIISVMSTVMNKAQ